MQDLQGIAAAPGAATGPAHCIPPAPLLDAAAPQRGSVADEIARLAAAQAQACAELDELRAGIGGVAGAILAAQAELLADTALQTEARAAITAGATAETAIHAVTARYAARLAALPDPYLAARAADVRETGRRLHAALQGAAGSIRLDQPAVLVAHDLAPGELLQAGPAPVLAVVMETGTATAHLAIVAQGLGIPAVVGVAGALAAIAPGTRVRVDGTAGTITAARRPARRSAGALRPVPPAPDRPGQTADGVPVPVYANIGSVAEARQAAAAGAEGIGLLRSESLAGAVLPSEEEQLAAYRAIAAILGRPVVVRTFDFGGDKPAPGLALPPEANPFLGQRGIRLALAYPDLLLRPQLRAIVRAAATADLRLLLPMVTHPAEVVQTRRLLDEAAAACAAAGHPARIPALGIMVETPAAALSLDLFADLIAFASVGTNDLLQYLYAADRTNPRVAAVAEPPGRPLLRLLAGMAATRLPLTVCGALAADPAALPLLVGSGVRTLSVPPARVAAVKQALAAQSLAAMQQQAQAARGIAPG
jgi:phosphoenolpyruvate-protein kinase (PTS system EI component)